MASNERRLRFALVSLAIVLMIGYARWFAGESTAFQDAAVVIGLYVLAIGGAHFYYALRGVEGGLTVSARVRFVTFVAALFVLTFLAVGYGSGRELGGLAVDWLIAPIAVATFVVYFLNEIRIGFQDVRA